jgi:hippurate hydrolase
MIQGIERVSRGLAQAAGIPEDRMPIVKVLEEEFTPALYNDPALTRRWTEAMKKCLGDEALLQDEPQMGGEDFAEYGRTPEKIPISMLWLGSVPSAKLKSGKVPSIHSPFYNPDPQPTLRTGITAFAAGVLDLLGKGK